MSSQRPCQPKAKNLRLINRQVDLTTKGLPENVEAERAVLGSVLLNDGRFDEIAVLKPHDFSRRRHQQIFTRMLELRAIGCRIDRVTVASELMRHDEIGDDGLSYLAELGNGLPQIPNLGSYVKLVRQKSAARRTILQAQDMVDEVLLGVDPIEEILARHVCAVQGMEEVCRRSSRIRRLEDLKSVFVNRSPVEYLVQPELPAKAIVCLTGDAESGKTTLACAWAREVLAGGGAVLILDRDKNPRSVICDRFERIEVTDSERLLVWDCEQDEEPPQPDSPVVKEWVQRMVAEGRSVLVIVDSLISFLLPDEDENSAADMRALFNRCRTLTAIGAAVTLIHHTNRNGEARGSSDFGPACDQAFLVKNKDRCGGRLLDVIRLQVEKSRYGLADEITYHYAGGKMERLGKCHDSNAPSLVKLLDANPGILSEEFVVAALKTGTTRQKARHFLKKGIEDGLIEVAVEGRRHRHWVRGSRPMTGRAD